MNSKGKLRSLRLSLRFIAPLALTLALLGYALLPLVDRLTLRWWDLSWLFLLLSRCLLRRATNDCQAEHGTCGKKQAANRFECRHEQLRLTFGRINGLLPSVLISGKPR